jgi:hypothetical protein
MYVERSFGSPHQAEHELTFPHLGEMNSITTIYLPFSLANEFEL